MGDERAEAGLRQTGKQLRGVVDRPRTCSAVEDRKLLEWRECRLLLKPYRLH